MNYLYIFILILIILAVSFYTQYRYESINTEAFTNNNKNNIVLLGDSILKCENARAVLNNDLLTKKKSVYNANGLFYF